MAGQSLYCEVINGKHDDNGKAAVADARRAIAASADFTRGGTPPVPDHDATERQRAERIEAEQHRLIAWAKAHGKLGGRLPKDDVGGGEHIVRLDEKADRVIKATQLEKHKGYGIALGSYTHGATPSEYLDRLNLQNLILTMISGWSGW